MNVLNGRKLEQLSQMRLTRRRRQQVIPAYHLVNALKSVVDHHRQVVGGARVVTEQDKVVDRARDISGQPVTHRGVLGLGAQANGGWTFASSSVALLLAQVSAGTRISPGDSMGSAAGCGDLRLNLTAGTEALVAQATLGQAVDDITMELFTIRLHEHRRIPLKANVGKIVQLAFLCSHLNPIQVFDSDHEPFAIRPCKGPSQNGRAQITDVQITRWRRSVTACSAGVGDLGHRRQSTAGEACSGSGGARRYSGTEVAVNGFGPYPGTVITINEVGQDVHVITTENWRLNSGLVVGQGRALVIDTGAGPRQGRAILEAVRKVTSLPLVVLNTHAHFDHYMGNAVFQRAGAVDFWSHRAAARAIEKYGDYQRSFVGVLEPEMGEGSGLDTRIVVPSRHLPGSGRRPALTRIDLGERQALVFSLGRGHTDNDVLVGVDDVVFAGDVVEQGADPSFEDSFPQEWVAALEQLADLERYRAVIPGHGLPVDHADVRGMAATMSTAIERIRATQAEQPPGQLPASITASMFRLPYGPGASRLLLDRLRQLDAEAAEPAPSDGRTAD